jgi:SMC interacting uncharacterized protein involved in chromosome segregation
MPQVAPFVEIRDPCVHRVGARRRRASIDQRFGKLERDTEEFDRQVVGAKAKCRAGNFEEASPRILEAERLVARMQAEVYELRRQVREAGVSAALR